MNLNILKSFACGQFIDNDISFIAKSQSGHLSKELKFPLNSSDCEEHMLPISSEAYFGKNDQAVLDPEYRRAQVIYPESYFCNFDPNNYDIIDIIQNNMNEISSNIKFVRDKLNIYSKDGHFKIHKDTPRSSNMIGTLVICFPSEFKGGDLVLHTDPPTIFQFDKLSATHFQWVAFYGDIDHEVKIVESGHRITLTYLINKTKTTSDSNSYSINMVKNILNNSDILPQGGFIGYGCKYLYSTTSDNGAFKGEDSIIYSSFNDLGIKPIVEHITFWQEKEDWGCYRCDCCKKDCLKANLIIVNRSFEEDMDICWNCSKTVKGIKMSKKYNMASVFFTAPSEFKYVNAENVLDMVEQCGGALTRNIYWINDPYNGESQKSIESEILYGNNPTSREEVYKRCIFLIYINSYNDRINGLYQNEIIPSHTFDEDEFNYDKKSDDESDNELNYDESDNELNYDEKSNDEKSDNIDKSNDVDKY